MTYNQLTTKQFITRAEKIHGNKYDYSKSNYVNSNTKVCIICPIHGEFWQTPAAHLNGQGCPSCGIVKRTSKISSNKDEFIKKAKKIYGNKYDYSKVEYINNSTKVCIICPIHGEFWQTPGSHLNGRGCNLCSKPIHDTQSFIEEAKKVHGDRYDYSKAEYIDSYTKICIICPEHGEFWQTSNNHVKGKGCPVCAKNYIRYLQEEKAKECGKKFVDKANSIHNYKYDYSKVEYINNHTPVCIICPEHGEFWQMPQKHLSGHGCPKCNESSLERSVRVMLEKNNISHIQECDYKHFKWLGRQKLDFYLPDYGIAIE